MLAALQIFHEDTFLVLSGNRDRVAMARCFVDDLIEEVIESEREKVMEEARLNNRYDSPVHIFVDISNIAIGAQSLKGAALVRNGHLHAHAHPGF